MPVDIFHDATNKVPKQDAQIVRVDMEQQEIGGRKSNLPADAKSPDMAIKHIPSQD